MIRTLVAALTIACLASATAARAETVYVHSGQHEGQGWTFLVDSGCWAVTAKHVLDDRAPAIIVGPGGVQAEATRIERHATLDIALLQLGGMATRYCSSSTLGDRDDRPLLDRLQHQDGALVFERRSGEAGRATGVSYGVESVPMRVLGISESAPTFSMRLFEPTKDRIVRSDSGGPLRFRGAGLGEGGLPLGILLGVQRDTVIAVRMDAVRAYVESLASPPAGDRDVSTSFSIAAFTGMTPDTSCAPLNILDPSARCGWRSRKTRTERISLILDLGPNPRPISGVLLRFEHGGVPQAVDVTTGTDVSGNAEWQPGHFCRLGARAVEVKCTLGRRTMRAVRIVVDGAVAHIREVRILDAR